MEREHDQKNFSEAVESFFGNSRIQQFNNISWVKEHDKPLTYGAKTCMWEAEHGIYKLQLYFDFYPDRPFLGCQSFLFRWEGRESQEQTKEIFREKDE